MGLLFANTLCRSQTTFPDLLICPKHSAKVPRVDFGPCPLFSKLLSINSEMLGQSIFFGSVRHILIICELIAELSALHPLLDGRYSALPSSMEESNSGR